MYVCVRDKLEQSVHAVKNVRLYWHQNLEVCESPESVADRCIGFERFTGVQNSAKLDWHQNPGSLRVSRKCRRPVKWLREVPICLNQGLI